MIRILHIEDNHDDAHLLQKALTDTGRADVSIMHAYNMAAGVEMLRQNLYDVVLLDLSLPDSHGLESVKRIVQETRRSAVIVLTGDSDSAQAIPAMQVGAQDYLYKGALDADRLWRSIRHSMERKKIENKLLRRERLLSTYKDGLESLIHTRTGQLEQANRRLQAQVTECEKLQLAMLLAEKMTAVGQLASGIAHEFNNPLTVILGLAQAMRSRPDDPQNVYASAESIERETQRCASLVRHLLTFARRPDTLREMIGLNRVVTDALALLNGQARMGQIDMVTELHAQLPDFWGNRLQLDQMIMHLAANAFEALEPRGKLLIATETETLGGKLFIKLRVSDNGGGIDPKILSRIFEPFFTTKPVNQGTGLGLSLVHEIVRKHQGSIDVQSALGRGTTFTLRFPAEVAENSDAA